MTDEHHTWSPVTNEVLLAMKGLTGLEFRSMQFQSGKFQVCAFLGDSKCIIREVGFGTFGQTYDRSLKVAETEMVDHLKHGVEVFATEFIALDAAIVLRIPPFSTIEELQMKAKLAGENPFRTGNAIGARP